MVHGLAGAGGDGGHVCGDADGSDDIVIGEAFELLIGVDADLFDGEGVMFVGDDEFCHQSVVTDHSIAGGGGVDQFARVIDAVENDVLFRRVIGVDGDVKLLSGVDLSDPNGIGHAGDHKYKAHRYRDYREDQAARCDFFQFCSKLIEF